MPFNTYHLGEHRDKIIKGTAPTARGFRRTVGTAVVLVLSALSLADVGVANAVSDPGQVSPGPAAKVTKAEVLSLGALYTDSALQPNLPP